VRMDFFVVGLVSLVIDFACFIVDLVGLRGFVASCCSGLRRWLWIICSSFGMVFLL